jgi:glycosyltransferase involved in cell wall biosynthesis
MEEGGRGGVSDYLAELATALSQRGVSVELVTADDHLYRLGEDVTVHGFMHYVRGTSALGRAARRIHVSKLWNGIRFLVLIPRVAWLSRRAEVVHTHGGEWMPLTALVALSLRVAGARLVYTPHNVFDRGGHQHRLSRHVLAHCAGRTIVHTRADVSHLPPPADRRAIVIPHGEYGGLARSGGTADRGDARRELGLSEDAFVVLLFGQLRPDKGIRDLLSAALDVAGVHALIAGREEGGLGAARDLLDDPGLSGRVVIREGWQRMEATARLFAAADAAALPYEVASQSGVLLLAYGFARPVIVYPVGGLPEAVIDGQTGWITARPDVDALADALRAAAGAGAEECRRRGTAGARLAEERYSWSEIARRTEEVYDEVAR